MAAATTTIGRFPRALRRPANDRIAGFHFIATRAGEIEQAPEFGATRSAQTTSREARSGLLDRRT